MNRKLTVISLSTLAVAIHAVLFVATNLGVKAANAALRTYGPADIGSVDSMLRYFYAYSSEALSGRIPYLDFPVEYPVLSFSLFLIPRLLVADFESYRIVFLAEMFLFDIAAILLIARHGWPHEDTGTVARRLGWYTTYCFLLAPLVIGRFELAPMVLAFASACWWFSGRQIAGGIAAGLGTLMKVFPAVVAALALVLEIARFRATRARGMAAYLCTVTIGLSFWLWLGGARVLESLRYHSERGLEVESLLGGVLMLVGAMTETKVPWVLSYHAYHVAPEWGARLAMLTFPLQAAAILLVMRRFWRSGMADGVRFSAAAVLAFITFCKVLSPQFLIWLFPFMAVLEGRVGSVARKMFLLCCLTTAMFYPGPGFAMVLDHQLVAIMLLNIRNGLLVLLLALLLYGHESASVLSERTLA